MIRKIFYKIESLITSKISTENWEKIQQKARNVLWVRHGMIEVENYGYYSATTMFMHRKMKEIWGEEKINLLSVGGRVAYVVPMIPFCTNLLHLSMIPMEEKDELKNICDNCNINQMVGDFFEFRSTEEFKRINVLVSHATIHCMNDTRYGNDVSNREFKSYLFAKKLVELCPNIKYAIVSVPVNLEEAIVNNSTHLSDRKFIKSFEDEGFRLESCLYDKKCLSENEYECGERFSKEFPIDYGRQHQYVVGNYCFVR